MAVDTRVLIKVLDEATASGMDSAIQKHGAGLTQQEIQQLKALTPQQIKDTLTNLMAADKALNKMLLVDTNNNNNKN